ncbi:VOC family protein [Labrys wisconsinensis]|uniref:3-demethylubiquinone-9 3-methyltransferase (Glyoxalase superfamily) n=1 Tax=Labrys wisconsinensis TaxID=425677 RepID=A0ABU0JCM4_9HYPH|nr:VOC family protein [Labrys wisconsinensis]MDQ0472023.1 putative 3-demethylubiquinone-9 3-methyltransferase (glyoxalase superfamily) [Labrys wisconsinensis]
MPVKQKITNCLWFDGNAEEAIAFYTAIFADSKVLKLTRYGKAGPGPEGSVMTGLFQLAGQEFIALNGGPMFKFTEAMSLTVNCETQEEVDHFWSRLTADGGGEGPCGWLKDRFGVSWQIVPVALVEMLSDGDAERAQRVMQAMLQMKKIDIAGLRRAYDRA